MLEACWRHAGGRLEASLKDLQLFGRPCSLGAVVEAGWRQAGGRLEAGWRQAGGMLEAGWRQAGDWMHHLRIYSFLANRAAWASGERSGRRTGAASELSCSLGAVVQPGSCQPGSCRAACQSAACQNAACQNAACQENGQALRVSAPPEQAAGWRQAGGRLEASLRDLQLFGQPCSLGAVVQAGGIT